MKFAHFLTSDLVLLDENWLSSTRFDYAQIGF